MKVLIGLLLMMFAGPISHLIHLLDKNSLDPEEIHCLALNAYKEAVGEGPLGMLLVTTVVMNRAHNKNESYCETVYKPWQFSWTKLNKRPVHDSQLSEVKHLIVLHLNGAIQIPEQYRFATHFHTVQVKPFWAKKGKYLGTYRKHRFYQLDF